MFDKLLIEAENLGINVEEHDFKNMNLKGLYTDGVIILNPAAIKSNTEKTCILAEELGHHYTSSGNILDQSNIVNIKQENKARNWGYEKLIPLKSFVDASKVGLANRYELAEYFEVTEDYLQKAIFRYKKKYGLYAEWKNYIIYFEPLVVLELFDD